MRSPNALSSFENTFTLLTSIDQFGIELCFPNAAWAQEYFPKLWVHSEENNIAFRVELASPSDADEYLIVNCGQDIVLARSLPQTIWTEVFGLSLEVRPRTPYYRLTLLTDVTRHAGQEPHSFKLGWLRNNGIDLPSQPPILLSGLWFLFWFIIFLGLPISQLYNVGETPDWSLTLGQFNLSGTTGSLVFFCFYVAGSFRRLYFRTRLREPRTWFDATIMLVWSCVITITVPISAIIIWTGS